MGKKCNYIKRPRTQNEKRQNQEGWCRAKRRPHLLADEWDDCPHGYQRNWKMFRKTQYHPGGRGQRYEIFVDGVRAWTLEEYLRDHSIPYDIEVVREFEGMRRFPVRKMVVVGQKPYWIYKYKWIKDENGKRQLKKVPQHIAGYKDIVEWKTVGYKKYKHYKILGYKIVWWSNKDIGVEHIIK